MMKPNDFEHMMENLETPRAENVTPPPGLKFAFVNARRSATLGTWFVVVPMLFLVFVILKYYLNLDFGLLQWMEEGVMTVDRNPIAWWIQPVLLFLLPAAGVLLNLLAIIHFGWDESTRTAIISIKIRWINIAIIVISLLIMTVFMLYLVLENFVARMN